MSHTSRKRTGASRSAPHRGCWSLVLIDGRPIREKARHEYQRILRDLEQARRELERFENEDKPGFERWLNRHLGGLLTELRETSKKVQSKRELLFEIAAEAWARNCSHARAYEHVLHRLENPEPESPEEDFFHSDPESDFAHFADEFDEGFDPFEGHGAAPDSAAHRQTKPVPARLKELYRALVRRLHPDVQRDMTPQRKERWHQAQAAYQDGDADQLELILTLCEIEEEGALAKTSVSLLMRITRQFKSSLRTLKLQLNRCRHDPAWNFSNSPDRGRLLARTERALQLELSDLKRALQAMDAQLESWARQARSGSRRGRRRSEPFREPEWF